MSDHHIGKRTRERPVRPATLDRREAQKSTPKRSTPPPVRDQEGGRRRWQPTFTPSGVPKRPPER